MRNFVLDAERRDIVATSLSDLIDRLGRGLDDGTYKSVPANPDSIADPLQRNYMALLKALAADGGIGWVDDRFTSSIDNPDLQITTTLEVVDALVRYRRLTEAQGFQMRQRLRAARWLFMPLRGEEIVHFVREAVRDGGLRETDDLALLRRSVGEALAQRRRLQWPDPSSSDQSVKGEVPFILDSGHAISEALATIWNDPDWAIADAVVASGWIIDTLEINLFPMSIFGAGDPRSDHILGTHLGALILVAIQIVPRGKASEERQVAYLDWLWRHLVANALRVRPELRKPLEDMIESHLTRTEDGAVEDRLWLGLGGRVLNALPLSLRMRLVERRGIREAFQLPDHGQVTIEGHDFDEAEFWQAIIDARSNDPRTITGLNGEKAVMSFVAGSADPHVKMRLGRRTMRLDSWPRSVASDDPEIRRQALEERAHEMDLSAQDIASLNAELHGLLPPWQRVRAALSKGHEAIRQWYADLGVTMRRKQAFSLWELKAPDTNKVLGYLRMGDDLEEAAAALIEARGLAVALRRFGGIPIVPPQAIAAAVDAVADTALGDLLDEVEFETAPPWTQLFIARLLVDRALPAAIEARLQIGIDRALSKKSDPIWQLYISLAQFAAQEAASELGWSDLNAAQQLAASWVHASALVEILVSGGVVIAGLLRLIEGHRLASPRLLVERLHKFEDDLANPSKMSVDRMRAHAAAPALNILRSNPVHSSWADEKLRSLVVVAAPKGKARPRMEVARGCLAPQDSLDSYLNAEWGLLFAQVYPGASALFRDGIRALLEAFLSSEAGTQDQLSGWHLLRQASGDCPLPAELASFAQSRAEMCPLDARYHGLVDARFTLLVFAALAARNQWHDQIDRIDAAAEALAPQPGEEDVMVMFEVAVWRSRLIEDPLERTKFLGQAFLRLGKDKSHREQGELAARQFARSLSGNWSEAFVDCLAASISSR